MLTTRNFRDVLHIGRHKRPHIFSLHFEVLWQNRPLVKRRNRIPITERILPPDGRVETPLDEDEVLAAVEVFRRRGIESVVIGFLFSFVNDAHERRAKAIVEREMPGAYVCCSSEVASVGATGSVRGSMKASSSRSPFAWPQLMLSRTGSRFIRVTMSLPLRLRGRRHVSGPAGEPARALGDEGFHLPMWSMDHCPMKSRRWHADPNFSTVHGFPEPSGLRSRSAPDDAPTGRSLTPDSRMVRSTVLSLPVRAGPDRSILAVA